MSLFQLIRTSFEKDSERCPYKAGYEHLFDFLDTLAAQITLQIKLPATSLLFDRHLLQLPTHAYLATTFYAAV